MRTLALAAFLVAAAIALSGCEQLCNTETGIGVFCPESENNRLNDPPVVGGDITFRPTAGSGGCGDKVEVNRRIYFELGGVFDPDGDPLHYEWDFDGDGDFESAGSAPSFRYSRPGTFHVRVRVTDFALNLGAPGTVERSARIVVVDPARDAPTQAAFTATAPAVVGSPVAFDAGATFDADVDDVANFRYLWDFGDGTFNPQRSLLGDGLRTVTHTYQSPGEYTVKLRVAECFLAPTGEAELRIAVTSPSPSNRAPTARFTTSPPAPVTGQLVTLDGSSSLDPNGRIVRYDWDLDGNGTYERPDAGPLATRAFEVAGEHVVGLRVTDDEDLVSANVGSITVTANRAPTARFVATPSTPFLNQTVRFDGSESSDPEGPIVRYEWDLDGNGSFETDRGSEPVATMSYALSGERFVRLRVRDAHGATAIMGHTIIVLPVSAPSASTAKATRAPLAFSARVEGIAVTKGNTRGRSLTGVVGRGSLRARLLSPPGRPSAAERALARFVRARWRTRVGFTFDRRTRRWSAEALALAQGTCLRVRLTDRPGRRPEGRVTLLGGGRLRGGGTVRFRLERDGSATVVGQLRVRLGKSRPLSRACARLATARGR